MNTCIDPMCNTFCAGFSAGDITPAESVPLQGYGDSKLRMSTNIVSQIYSRCLAVRDDSGTTALLISIDNAALTYDICNTIRSMIEKKTGVPAGNIMLSAIHLHCSPDYDCNEIPSSQRYKTLFINATVQAAVDAIADLAPAEMYIASAETQNLNFVRNYICNDGTCAGPNYGSFASGPKDHESKADSTLQLLKFVRCGKKDIVIANFQCHPYRGTSGTKTEIHADFIGVFRDTLEKKLDCNTVYFSGASGNIEPFSLIEAENITNDMYEQGKKLAAYALDAEKHYIKIKSGAVRTMVCENIYHTDKSQNALYDRAAEFMRIWQTNGQLAAADALVNFPEFHSIYHAKYVVIKHDLPDTRKLPLWVIAFGDVAFTGIPTEIFDTNGMETKAGSPFPITFIASLTNGWDGYIPSQLGYTNGGYSTDITRYAQGTGEQVVQDLLHMLRQLHN